MTTPPGPSAAPARMTPGPPVDLLSLLRCLNCGGSVLLVSLAAHPGYPELGADGQLACDRCGDCYPLIAGTVRALPHSMRSQLWNEYPRAHRTLGATKIPRPAEGASVAVDIKRRTAESFAYEWQHFGLLRDEWRKNFADYMRPHVGATFATRLLLDVGTGSGRHAFHAAELGARVVAVDIGRSIDVARRNLPPSVLTVQADADHLPFARGAFDFAMSIGVLHHLPNPQETLCHLVSFARPGGFVHIYVYWLPERRGHARVLRLVSLARRVTVKLPHPLLHAVCVPLAVILAIVAVWPYKLLRHSSRFARVADAFPLKAYADYPLGVLLNDQFDRFSAPLEHRYTEDEVRRMLEAAGLTDIRVVSNHGWIGDGRVPSPMQPHDANYRDNRASSQ